VPPGALLAVAAPPLGTSPPCRASGARRRDISGGAAPAGPGACRCFPGASPTDLGETASGEKCPSMLVEKRHHIWSGCFFAGSELIFGNGVLAVGKARARESAARMNLSVPAQMPSPLPTGERSARLSLPREGRPSFRPLPWQGR
jgi:hypothetical protein